MIRTWLLLRYFTQRWEVIYVWVWCINVFLFQWSSVVYCNWSDVVGISCKRPMTDIIWGPSHTHGQWSHEATETYILNYRLYKIQRFTQMSNYMTFLLLPFTGVDFRRHRVRDCMVVGFITSYAISVYHHSCCEFESRSGDKVCQWLASGRCFSPGYSDFLHQENWPPLFNWNIVESGVKHHNLNHNPGVASSKVRVWNIHDILHVSLIVFF